ncbi:MAG: adenosylcobalamin-dependent ribonucleoside-diphosphate reductase [bacterium]|nr:adenosylcobalamin-dependent ribonucleoside-diphosphate reductase [bacterium]MDZ4247798.1 adenosylcobalamin-dependent ribonucleoside-diphosphate reductase [Patescibacteria group bacterium]
MTQATTQAPRKDLKQISLKGPIRVKKGTKLDGIRKKVFLDRYAWKDSKGEPIEEYPEQMWGRVAKALAAVEAPERQKEWEQKFYDAMEGFKFVPAGRILSGAGTGHQVTFYNCFVIPSPEDSRDGILDNLKAMTEIMCRAGGVGVNISSLRPRGSHIKTVNGTSSGPIPWAELYSVATHDVIQQGGTRRGALMLMLDDTHPDLEEFITAKRDLKKLIGSNISVCISDGFMQAVKDDTDWDLKWGGKVYKTVKAKKVWNMICESAHASAEPGLHFMERSNKRSNTWYYEKLISTNPCGEQPLGEWAVCNLGALNLSAFVTEEGEMDYTSLADHARTAVRALDNVVDANYYFFKENEEQQMGTRRTGLGTMGLGDALIKMKLRYGSDKSLDVIEKIYKTIRDAAYDSSAELAKEKAPFPMFDRSKYMQGWFIKRLSKDVQAKISKYGIRNAVVLTQAPTGTTSLVSGVSSGIEPVYDFAMKRTDRTGEHILYHPLFKAWKDEHSEEAEAGDIPDYFATSNDLMPMDHVKVQAKIQEYTDSSISKTVNAPNSYTVDQVKELYEAAYDMGLKGVTFYRDGSRDAVLTRVADEKKEKGTVADKAVSPEPRQVRESGITPPARPSVLRGLTVKQVTAYGNMYVTMNTDEQGDLVEVFASLGKAGGLGASMTEAICRLVSTSLRAGVSPRAIIKELRGITDQPYGFGDNKVTSVADAIGKTIEDYLYPKLDLPETGKDAQTALPTDPKSEAAEADAKARAKAAADAPAGDPSAKLAGICPDCGGPLEFASGCKTCHACGYSACG